MMRKAAVLASVVIFSAIMLSLTQNSSDEAKMIDEVASAGDITLPQPRHSGDIPLEEAIYLRRSTRQYSNEPLSLSDVSQILWAACGKTEGWRRSIPSAGALYPLEIYLVAAEVEGVPSGLYHYDFERNILVKKIGGDLREDLANAALGQEMIKKAPATVVITAVYERTTGKYKERGIRYVHMEAGHSGQNIYLQAASLGLGTVAVGAFHDQRVSETLKLPQDHVPLYIMPVGKI
jgi:SagB-type dehydrogenase family enzyme